MKKIACCFILMLIALQLVLAQRAKPKISITKITTLTNESVKGILYQMTDSSVSLYTNKLNVDISTLQHDSLPLKIFTYRDIEKIKVRRRNSLPEGALIGAGSGI